MIFAIAILFALIPDGWFVNTSCATGTFVIAIPSGGAIVKEDQRMCVAFHFNFVAKGDSTFTVARLALACTLAQEANDGSHF